MLSIAPPGVPAEIIEEMTDGPQTPGPHTSAVGAPLQERESSYKKLGLTRQVLAAHTQKEEQAFLCRIRELRGVTSFKADCSHYLERQRGHVVSDGTERHTHAHARAHTHARTHARTHTHRHAFIHVTYTHVNPHACIHTCDIHAHAHTDTYSQTNTRARTHTHACIYTRAYQCFPQH